MLIPILVNSICVGIFSSILLMIKIEKSEKYVYFFNKRHILLHILPAMISIILIPFISKLTCPNSISIVLSVLFMIFIISCWLIFRGGS